MAVSTRRDTDFNIRAALRRNRQLLTGAQESGRAALAGYEGLAPKYNTAVKKASDYQSTLTRDYDLYVEDREKAVADYDTQLQNLNKAYQDKVKSESGLESTFKSAEKELNRLGGIKDSSATEATRLYGTYSTAYQSGVQTGEQQYETKLGDFQQQFKKIQKDYNRYQGNIDLLNRQISAQAGNMERQRKIAQQYLGTAELGGQYVVGDANKIFRIFRDDQDQFTGAQEYRPQGSGYAQGLMRVTDQTQAKALQALADSGTKSFADAVYQRYLSGASPYGTYQAVATITQDYSKSAKKAIDEASVFERNIKSFQAEVPKVQKAMSDVITQNRAADKAYEDFVGDTGFVTRIAEQQSAGALQSYQNYLKDTYNPTVNAYNQYASVTYNPAAQAYQTSQSQVKKALQSYQSLQQDTGFVDRAASDTKAVYDASQKKYSGLQAVYEGMTPQLNQYTKQAEAAKQQVLTLAGQTPDLQRSLAIDTEARKRGDRLGYRRSLLGQGYKRRGAAR